MRNTYELENVTRWYLRYGQLQPALALAAPATEDRGKCKSQDASWVCRLRHVTLTFLPVPPTIYASAMFLLVMSSLPIPSVTF